MNENHNESEETLVFYLFLARITFLTCQEKLFLSKNIDNYSSFLLLSIEDIALKINRKIKNRVVWNAKENLRMAERSFFLCKQFGIKIILFEDEEFPQLLRQINDPPFLLFCRGNYNLLQQNCISVVGTRKITPNGKNVTRKFSYDACLDKKNIVSGLAIGVDSFAHQGCVDAFFDFYEQNKDTSQLGKTIAVLPCGIDTIMPSRNKILAERILFSGGCIISEFEPGEFAPNWHYVGRNRIIAGLSNSIVVIEAPTGSGALITVDFALENGRDVFFHQGCFSKNANEVSKIIQKRLETDFAIGKISKYKIENTVEKYVESGAPIIKDYKDYCIALNEIPGTRNIIDFQEELFK